MFSWLQSAASSPDVTESFKAKVYYASLAWWFPAFSDHTSTYPLVIPSSVSFLPFFIKVYLPMEAIKHFSITLNQHLLLKTLIHSCVWVSSSLLWCLRGWSGSPSAWGQSKRLRGGEKEGDFQIKAEECAVKNLRIRLGLALNVWLLGERKRGTEMERRTRGETEREKEHFSEEKGSAVRGVSRQGPALPRKWICLSHKVYRRCFLEVFLCVRASVFARACLCVLI